MTGIQSSLVQSQAAPSLKSRLQTKAQQVGKTAKLVKEMSGDSGEDPQAGLLIPLDWGGDKTDDDQDELDFDRGGDSSDDSRDHDVHLQQVVACNPVTCNLPASDVTCSRSTLTFPPKSTMQTPRHILSPLFAYPPLCKHAQKPMEVSNWGLD